MSTWPMEKQNWASDCRKLLLDGGSRTKPVETLKEIVEKSKKFPIKFPITSVLCENLEKTVQIPVLNKNIQSVYPIIHEHVLNLCANFLLFKQNHGSENEKSFYKSIDLFGLIDRLLKKRAVTFMGGEDSYLLIDKSKGYGNWETIGTNREKRPLILENCLSYDEIKLSALLSVSSHTYFINDGNRFNAGSVEGDREKVQEDGVIVGLIGTRFEVAEKMEYQEIIISLTQNTKEKGYGGETPSLPKVFADFYGIQPLLYNDKCLNDNSKFIKLEDELIFDKIAYERRLAISFDTLLIEANHRAKLENKTAYIHVVGIGLGVWKISSKQTQIFMDTFGKRLKFFGSKLDHVSDVHFAYISGATNCLGYKNNEIFPIADHPNNGIKILISKREPSARLPDKDKLLVISYAWDGNAFPGNEFWVGMLTSTGDTSTACSTQIAELHNPLINQLVSVENLHVAMLDGCVKHINDFVSSFVPN